MVFGANARLDVAGSFMASSADRLVFGNGFTFSASDPQTPPLLTISVPIGLQTGANPGDIRIQEQGSGQGGLEVGRGQTLALVGGEVRLEGGNLRAAGGRIELGSVAGGSTIALTPEPSGWGLNYLGVGQFQDIFLTQAARVDASGSGGGRIQVQGRRLSLTEGAYIGTQTQGTQAGRDLTIRATESVDISGVNPQDGSTPSALTTLADPDSTGSAGNITIDTGTLNMIEGAAIISDTIGAGKGGDITVRAQSVNMVGSLSFFSSSTSSDQSSTGDAGNITIDTGTLNMTEGAYVLTSSFGTGKAGDITIRAQSVNMAGFFSFLSSGGSSTGDAGNITIDTEALNMENVFVTTNTTGSGKGGNITVQAQSVDMVDSYLSSSSFLQSSTGDAGNITIDTGTLNMESAFVITDTSGSGRGGNITVRAQSVNLVGFQSFFSSETNRVPTRDLDSITTGDAGNIAIDTGILSITEGASISSSTFGSGKGGNITVRAQSVNLIGFDPVNGSPSLLAAQAGRGSTGNAGDVYLTVDRLTVANRGTITTLSQGTGGAGNVTIQAGSRIALADAASINANTNAGQGNITLTTPLLLMRRNSSITTNASGAATGGNITIDTRFLVAGQNENNDIISNAFAGSGGQIRLNAQSIFGFDVLTRQDLQQILGTTNPTALDPRLLPSNDITAFSQARPDLDVGSVSVQTPDVDPSRGLVQLSTDLQDTSGLIASACPADEGNSFAITGRGGLPDDPRQPLMSGSVWLDDRAPAQPSLSNPQSVPTLIEAQGWLKQPDGSIHLVATYSDGNAQAFRPLLCAVRSN